MSVEHNTDKLPPRLSWVGIELDETRLECVQSVIPTQTDVCAGVPDRAALTDDYLTRLARRTA